MTPTPPPFRVAAVVVVQAVAVAVLAVAWYGASGEVRVADQWAWGALSGSALALSVLANATVIVGFRRRLARAAGRF